MNKIFSLIFSICLVTWIFPDLLNAQSDYKLAEQDSLALVAFYWATDGPNWKSNQDGFGFNDLTSEWQGVYDGGFSKWQKIWIQQKRFRLLPKKYLLMTGELNWSIF